MAKIIPTIEEINSQKVKPTAGELTLLRFLDQKLDNSYEVYFQPFLNGDMPDIVIMRKNSGVLIIEVKDWELNHYEINEKNEWFLKLNGAKLKSPFKQVANYKDNLYNLHIDNLLKLKSKNKKYYSIINCAVYFHNIHKQELEIKLNNNISVDKFIYIIGKDSLNEIDLLNMLSKFWMNRTSMLFSEELYTKILRFLQPPFHTLENGKNIVYTTAQQNLVISDSNKRQKIKGVAGSGKTLVLAKRAVNAYLRTKKRVLILTYNLTLCNYVHDRISDVRENFEWSSFYITNYHKFFLTEANNLGLKIENINCYEDTEFFELRKGIIIKYDAIFIDEVQDYQQEWIDIIVKYFLETDGEFVVFGDEKQNIYDREMDDDKEPKIRTIPGRWNKSLNSSHRFTSQIASLAMKFQKEFFNNKYFLDSITVFQNNEIEFENKLIKYYYSFDNIELNITINKVIEIMNKYNLHSSNISILNSKVEFLRNAEEVYKNISHEETTTNFESKEEYLELVNTMDNKEIVKQKLHDLRRNKKEHFWMNTGKIKFCTIHSFKGWETHTLILILNKDIDEKDLAVSELIYTGLTRARINVFIINLGNLKYHPFFMDNVDEKYKLEK